MKYILEAGRLAPTAFNKQPQRVYILKSGEALQRMDSVHPCRYGAPMVILVCSDKNAASNFQGEETGVSRNQIQRYIRLTNLIPEILDMVDNKQIGFNPAAELSFLDENQQRQLLEAMDFSQSTPSLGQAQRMKKLALNEGITHEDMNVIMSEEKKSDVDRVTLKNDVLKKYFPKSYTPKQMEDTIVKLLDQWQKKRLHDHNIGE